MTQRTRPASTLISSAPRDPLMTYEEFLEADHENNHVEWVNGEVIKMAPIGDEHQEVGGFLYTLVRHFVEAHDLGVVRYDPFQMKTGPDLPGRAPDILFLSKRNFGRKKKTYVDGPADVVIEIISPGSRGVDRGDKYFEYEQGGVKEYWLVDPARKQAEFYRLGKDKLFHFIEFGDDGVFRSNVLKGFWIKVTWLWERPKVLDVLKQWGLV